MVNPGERWVWLSACALTLILIATITVIGIIFIRGGSTFWMKDLALVKLKNTEPFLAKILEEDTNIDTGNVQVKLKVGNRHIYGLDFRWVNRDDVIEISYPDDAIVIERYEYGDFHGFLKGVQSPQPLSGDLQSQLEQAQEVFRSLNLEQIEEEIKILVQDARVIKKEQQKLIYYGKEQTQEMQALNAEENIFKQKLEALLKEQNSLLKGAEDYQLELVTAGGKKILIPITHVVRTYRPNQMSFWGKLNYYFLKVKELLLDSPRESNTEGGLYPAIFGTVTLVIIMSIFAFPFGVIAAIYLREYANSGVTVRLIRLAVNNLAGIPSIVYGVFGLGFFVYGVGGAIDRAFFPEFLPTPTFGSGGVLWASLTLSLLTLPVVIVATEEAIGAVPKEIKEASFALGATKWQTLWRVIIPMSSPGIMTGFILAMSRAAGEVAPLMITGVVKLAPSVPIDSQFPYVHLERKFMHLGFHIFDVGFQSPNIEAAKPMVFVTTLLLLLIVLLLSASAIYLRAYMKKRYTIKAF